MTKPDDSTEAEEPFSYPKRRSIAVAFAEAYLGGQLKVKFPTPAEFERDRDLLCAIAEIPKEQARKISSTELAGVLRRTFDDNAWILLRRVESSEETYRATVNWFIELIWRMRNGRRIDGEFLAVPNIESRVDKLEEEVRKHGNALDELRILLRLSEGGSGANP
jgi:hypothetical protein